MRPNIVLLFLLYLLPASEYASGQDIPLKPLDLEKPLTRIGFGSCAKQFNPQPIWEAVVAARPELFILLGDNIYADTQDMTAMQAMYQQFADVPKFRQLRAECPLLAVWDDHDYGKNDAGIEYPKKVEAQQVFLDFIGEPQDSARRKTPGIYDAKIIGIPGQRVQIILLDTRYFRSALHTRENRGNRVFGNYGPYGPHNRNDNSEHSVLGEAQWKWLAEQLRQPAELRIIASSIQFIAEEHGFEKWGNFPLERDRLLKLIAETKANGVVFLSGDRHHAEISKLENPTVGYPLYDITSSSLNAPSGWQNERNRHRLGSIYRDENFGMLFIDWDQEQPTVTFEIRGLKGKTKIAEQVALSQLQNSSSIEITPQD
ncbi:alkaline phosphatase D family protein [Calycomorphotria hydatis]|nr:alkaline phosphatase D family protein [Calycomorphotria hydatis]